jgi:hypothetical protein
MSFDDNDVVNSKEWFEKDYLFKTEIDLPKKEEEDKMRISSCYIDR